MPKWIIIQQPLSSVRVPVPLVPIVESEALQSLRRAPTWNCADLVYPASKNDRFEHALGSLERAQALLAALKSNAPELTEILDAADELHYLAAALLHDIAFAATPILDLIAEAKDETLLPRTGTEMLLQSLAEPLKSIGLDPAALAGLIHPLGNGQPRDTAGRVHSDTEKLLVDCLYSPVGCIQSDAHPRNAFHAGLGTENDLPRTFGPSLVPSDSYDSLAVPPSMVRFTRLWLESTSTVRHTLYYHPRVRAARAMIKKAIDSLQMEPAEILRALAAKTVDACKDWIATQGNVVADALVRGTRIGERGLYRTVLSVYPGQHGFVELGANPGVAEIELTEFLGLQRDEIIVESHRAHFDPETHVPFGWCPVIDWPAHLSTSGRSGTPHFPIQRTLEPPPVEVFVTPAKADRILKERTPEVIINHVMSHVSPS